MSNRYVWARNNLGVVTDYSDGNSGAGNTHDAISVSESDIDASYGDTFYVYSAASYHVSGNKFVLDSPEMKSIRVSYSVNETIYREENTTDISRIFALSSSPASSFDAVYTVSGSSNSAGVMDIDLYARNYAQDLTFQVHMALGTTYGSASGSRRVVGKGTANGTVSNSASSTYPQDGISGNYWYTYQGSDSIDAAAVGYSNQAPMGGQPITINVTPTTPTYGGTIRYTYQVQLDGRAWTPIATNVTATSRQYTIPAGTNSFAARVLASDTWGFSSSDYTTGTTLSVTNNLPPTAPASISFGEPVAGDACTITWGAATDSDGTVTGYELERNVDGGDSWTQIYSGSALSYEDNVDPDWATVNYRVRAVDDDGDKGAYATGSAQAVNDGWLFFSGPDEAMGTKSAPFDFAFAINSTPAGAQSIDVHVYLDDDEVYSSTLDAAEQVSVHVDMRPMRSGEHVIVVTAECGELLGVNKVCTFSVPEFALPEGGYILQLRDDDGVPIFPQTLISGVRGAGGQSAAGILEQSYYSTYIGTGTSGQGNPCQTRLAFHPSLMIIQASGNSAAAIGYWVRTAAEDAQDQGNMVVYNGTTQTLIPVRWDEETMTISYYGNSAAEQLNASGVVYGIRIL